MHPVRAYREFLGRYIAFLGWNVDFLGWNSDFLVWYIAFLGWYIAFRCWNFTSLVDMAHGLIYVAHGLRGLVWRLKNKQSNCNGPIGAVLRWSEAVGATEGGWRTHDPIATHVWVDCGYKHWLESDQDTRTNSTILGKWLQSLENDGGSITVDTRTLAEWRWSCIGDVL